jgi:hypothetical protein
MGYFMRQNKLIAKGEVAGIELELKTLGIGNGVVDAAVQFPSVSPLARRLLVTAEEPGKSVPP